jgi:hypothetical protein
MCPCQWPNPPIPLTSTFLPFQIIFALHPRLLHPFPFFLSLKPFVDSSLLSRCVIIPTRARPSPLRVPRYPDLHQLSYTFKSCAASICYRASWPQLCLRHRSWPSSTQLSLRDQNSSTRPMELNSSCEALLINVRCTANPPIQSLLTISRTSWRKR